MEKEVFSKLADILDVDAVEKGDVLRDFDAWDSLSVLSILSLADSRYGIPMKMADLAPFSTIGDLVAYLSEKRTK